MPENLASRDPTLWRVLDDFRPSEILGWDLAVGLAAAGAAVWAAVAHRSAILIDGAPVLVGLLAIVIGAVVAALALMSAFMSPEFLRNVAAIGRSPLRYLAPFLFTAVLGIGGCLGGLVLSMLSPNDPRAVVATAAAIAIGLSTWSLVSVVRCLNTLVQFVQLQEASAHVGHEVPQIDDARSRRAQ